MLSCVLLRDSGERDDSTRVISAECVCERSGQRQATRSKFAAHSAHAGKRFARGYTGVARGRRD